MKACVVFLAIGGWAIAAEGKWTPDQVLKIYPPLAAGLMTPFRGDRFLVEQKRCQLDRLYQQITDDLDLLLAAIGLKLAA